MADPTLCSDAEELLSIADRLTALRSALNPDKHQFVWDALTKYSEQLRHCAATLGTAARLREALEPFAKIEPCEIAFSKAGKIYRLDYNATFDTQLLFKHFQTAREALGDRAEIVQMVDKALQDHTICERRSALLTFIIACVLVGGFFFWALGYHIVHKPADAQLFGCEHTYVNEKGEDTSECR